MMLPSVYVRTHTLPLRAYAHNPYDAFMAARSKDPDHVAPWRAMLLAHNRALRAIEASLDAAGTIPLTWYDVLLELSRADGQLRMQDLGERTVLSRTRISRIVDELEQHGLVRREPDPDDGRAIRATITADGRAAFRATAPHYLQGIDEHFTSHLTPAERLAITSGLTRVFDAHEAANRPR